METKFQTSFIPKKAAAPSVLGNAPGAKRVRTSIFMTLATLVFIASLAAAGGSYAWKQYLVSSQKTYKDQLVKRQEQFNINLIEDLKQANIKINLAKQLIGNHIAASQIFDSVSRLTVEKVRFLDMEINQNQAPGQQNSGLTIEMRGKGNSFSTVAFQSDVLSQLEQYNLRRSIRNPILADPTASDDGSVSFSFSATIDPQSISYEKSVTAAGSEEVTDTPTQ